jgi:signal transduction histidine kinase
MAGADRGLLRLSGNGVCRIESETVGLPRVLTCLARDDLGFAWFGSPQGIYRAPAAELNALADGRGEAPTAIRYGRGDGLLTAECTSGHQPSVCKTSDGRLWFATTRGVAVIDPAALSTNQYAPPVQIEQAQIFGEHGSVMTTNVRGGKLRIGPGARRVEISYAAPSYTAPERLRFRYRLEGSRDDWTEAGSRRVAYYEGLEPGDYLFRVIAGNTDGPWNENGATLGFRIEARFWQTRWFKVLVAATGVALAWGMFLLRLAQVNEVNRLRLRIARDLHDEIGANLGSIGLNTELLMSDATVGEQHRRDLAGIDQLTAQTAQSVREIVWMTNPEFDSLDGMLRRMRELATLMLAGRQWTFEAPGSGSSKALPLEVRRNMFFAFKECLHNVVKHSSATRVSIVARVEASWIEVTVEDNGAGFDPAAAKTSGTGLRSMRRRMEELGGAAEVRSANGGGAQIRLRASLRRTGAWRRWWAPPE